jgi:hypothetical protein
MLPEVADLSLPCFTRAIYTSQYTFSMKEIWGNFGENAKLIRLALDLSDGNGRSWASALRHPSSQVW